MGYTVQEYIAWSYLRGKYYTVNQLYYYVYFFVLFTLRDIYTTTSLCLYVRMSSRGLERNFHETVCKYELTSVIFVYVLHIYIFFNVNYIKVWW